MTKKLQLPTAVSAWTGEIELGDGGLVLRDLRHDKYRLAKDMRVVAVYAGDDPTRPNSWRELVLGSKDLPAIDPNDIAINKKPSVELLAEYPLALDVSSKFNTPGEVLGAPASGDSQALIITQRYLFTTYSNYPFHEPLGTLTAARVYPIIQFYYKGQPGERRPLRFLRFDYRFEFMIDAQASMSDLAIGPLKKFYRPQARYGHSQAAVMRDPDKAGRQLFAAAEKPLPSEAIGQGLRAGLAADWDNIHIWGALTNELPSTPGVNHGAHVHWRWGEFLARPTVGLFSFPSGPQFSAPAGPNPTVRLAGHGLVDWRIQNQDLRFAVTGDDHGGRLTATPDPKQLKDFDAMFTADKPLPMKDGAPSVVVWLSWSVSRDPAAAQAGAPWEGTLMLNGVYFAHDPEDPDLRLVAAGSLKEMHVPGTTSGPNGWVRP